MRLTFGPWRPDLEDLQSEFVHDLSGVLPAPNCWLPWPTATELTAALPSQVLGAIAGVTADGEFFCFAGTAAALYKLDVTDYTWDDVTRTSGGDYSASTTEPWRFTLFEYGGTSSVIACQINDAPQRFDIGSSTNFAALANAPQARVPRVWGPHLVLLSLNTEPNALNGSDINDITVWTPLSNNNAFEQAFSSGGRLLDASESTQPIILQEEAITRGAIVGRPQKVAFDTISTKVGCRFPESVAVREDRVFWLADSGFYSMSATDPGPVPIGFGHVDRYVLERASIAAGDRVMGQVDPAHDRVYWAFSEGEAALTTLVAFDWRLGQWSKVDVNLDQIFRFQTPGISLDALDAIYGDLDSVPFSLDSRALKSGAPLLGVVTRANKVGAFNGGNAAAYVVSPELTGDTLARWRLTGAYPIVDGGPVTVTPWRRDDRSAVWTKRPAVSANSRGWFPLRSTGRFHRLRLDIPADTEWSKAQGFDVQMQPEGER